MSLIWSIDVSNYQTADISALVAAHRPQHVVVRLSLEDDAKRSIAVAQLHQVVSLGLLPGGYGWPLFDEDPVLTVNGWLDLCAEVPVEIAILWIDCEEGTHAGNSDQVRTWLDTARAHARNLETRVGVYTTRNWWQENTDGWDGFGGVPLWVAQPDNVPTLESAVLPQGWLFASGKQWSWDGGVDRNVFLPEVCGAPDPYRQLREGLLAITHARPYRPPSKRRLLALLDG